MNGRITTRVFVFNIKLGILHTCLHLLEIGSLGPRGRADQARLPQRALAAAPLPCVAEWATWLRARAHASGLSEFRAAMLGARGRRRIGLVRLQHRDNILWCQVLLRAAKQRTQRTRGE